EPNNTYLRRLSLPGTLLITLFHCRYSDQDQVFIVFV
ncbi:MAG: hypothetical protein ACI9T7_003194, partial [Oleiphilaceae bacterium]